MEEWIESDIDENNNEQSSVCEERVKVGKTILVKKTSILPRSKVKNHCRKVAMFDNDGNQVGDFKLECNYCTRSFVHNGTNGITTHLTTSHPNKCKDLKPVPKKPIPPHFEKHGFNEDVFFSMMMDWIIDSNTPFSAVENEKFKKMIDYLRNGVTTKSRRTFMRRLESLFEQKELLLKENLSKLTCKYSITCDIWTASNALQFFAVTIHYIDENWNHVNSLLAFKYLEEVQHTGENLANILVGILEKFEIADRLLAITADNASNNTKMIVALERYYAEKYPQAGFSLAWNKIECMAHVINLAAQEIFKPFQKPINNDSFDPENYDELTGAVTKVSIMCRKIKGSPTLVNFIRQKAKENDLNFLKVIPSLLVQVILDVPTRWNSTYDMLERYMELLKLINVSANELNDPELLNLKLNTKEEDCIKDLIRILKPLKKATLAVSASNKEQSIGICQAFQIYDVLINLLQKEIKKIDDDDVESGLIYEKMRIQKSGIQEKRGGKRKRLTLKEPLDIKEGLENAVEKLKHYYDQMSPIIGISMVLNPELKISLFKKLNWHDEWIETVESQLRDSFEYYSQRNQNNTNLIIDKSPKVLTGTHCEFFEEYLVQAKTTNKVHDELDYYFNKCSGGTDNILGYWSTNRKVMPVLSAMARDYLAVQISSVPSERAFSSGGLLVTDSRSNLKGTTIEMVQFIKYHF